MQKRQERLDPMDIYGFSALSLDGQEIALSKYRGQVLLIVNTASKCGFTPQYSGLEALYREYAARGFTVLGFPCNQFAGQEPGNASEISQFCNLNYGVTFPLFSKVDVNGAHAHPLYKFLRTQQPGVAGLLGMNAIRWNFTKFLVDREGQVVGRFAPTTAPDKLKPRIEKLLQQAGWSGRMQE